MQKQQARVLTEFNPSGAAPMKGISVPPPSTIRNSGGALSFVIGMLKESAPRFDFHGALVHSSL